MINKKTKPIWIVLGFFLIISLASTLSDSVKDIGFSDTLITFCLLVAIVLGARYWIRKSRK